MPAYCPHCDRDVETDDVSCPACASTLVRPQDTRLIGKVIDGRYDVMALLGKGGMGEVYLARQRIIEREVALKVLLPELAGQPDLVRRFLREAKAMGRLASERTVRLLDFGVTSDGAPYFTMELLAGETLAGRLARERRLTPVTALDVSLQICESLREAHGKGILHRDLKPENVFLVSTPTGGWQVKLLDFGIAKILDDGGTATSAGQLLGTPRYIAPEVLRGEPVDGRADIYALALMLYEMLSGDVCYRAAAPAELLARKLTGTEPAFESLCAGPDVPEALCSLIRRAAAHDPACRPSSIEQFEVELRRFRDGAPVIVAASGNGLVDDNGPTRLRAATPPAGAVTPPAGGTPKAALEGRARLAVATSSRTVVLALVVVVLALAALAGASLWLAPRHVEPLRGAPPVEPPGVVSPDPAEPSVPPTRAAVPSVVHSTTSPAPLVPAPTRVEPVPTPGSTLSPPSVAPAAERAAPAATGPGRQERADRETGTVRGSKAVEPASAGAREPTPTTGGLFEQKPVGGEASKDVFRLKPVGAGSRP